jgi:hypothetical protein
MAQEILLKHLWPLFNTTGAEAFTTAGGSNYWGNKNY